MALGLVYHVAVRKGFTVHGRIRVVRFRFSLRLPSHPFISVFYFHHQPTSHRPSPYSTLASALNAVHHSVYFQVSNTTVLSSMTSRAACPVASCTIEFIFYLFPLFSPLSRRILILCPLNFAYKYPCVWLLWRSGNCGLILLYLPCVHLRQPRPPSLAPFMPHVLISRHLRPTDKYDSTVFHQLAP